MPRFRLLLTVLALAAAVAAPAGAAPRTHHVAKPSPTRGVVLVETNLAYENAAAAGTGIVLTPSGEVLTNNHVIRGATTITVVLPATHRRFSASVLGYDIRDDVALLKLDGASGLATATRGNSAKLKVGQATTAVGNANGGGRLVITKGRITGLRQTIMVNDDEGGTAQLAGLIRTSARLVPGDSGGPLLDANGRVIGVDAAGSAGYAFQASDGYAIPINKAITLVKTMEAGTSTTNVHIGKTAFLGVSVAQGTAGLQIASVVSGGAAEQAGLQQGDVITAVDGQPIASLDDLRTQLFPHHPGDAITVSYTDPLGNATDASVVLADGPPQ